MRTYQFQFNMPTKVYFGDGAIQHLDAALSPYGKKVLMVFDKNTANATGIYDIVTAMFKENGYTWWEYSNVDPNPRLTSVVEGAKICKDNGIEAVLAIGGGSVIDCSKAICAAALYDGDPWDFSRDRNLLKAALPLVVICTMASTGSEMNAGAIITNTELKIKGGGFGNELLIPKVSILDPKYTYSVPKRHVAAGCADIFIHTIERYFDPVDDIYLIDGFAESVLRTCVKYGPIALAEPDNFEARANLQWAAPWAISNLTGGPRLTTSTLHPLQHPIGAYHDIVHGEGLAILMPHWMRYILGKSNTIDKFATYGVNVFDLDPSLPKEELANRAIEATEDFFFNKLGIPRTLSEIGVTEEFFDEMAEQAAKMGHLMYKPLTEEDVKNIYKAAM